MSKRLYYIYEGKNVYAAIDDENQVVGFIIDGVDKQFETASDAYKYIEEIQ